MQIVFVLVLEALLALYFDHAQTTALKKPVHDAIVGSLDLPFGDPTRRHAAGRLAAEALDRARWQAGSSYRVGPESVVFTSGGTEANHLAIFGLVPHLKAKGRTHVVASTLEHPSVRAPLRALESLGFDVTWIRPGAGGAINAWVLSAALREDTGLVAVQHVDHESGVVQPIEAVADAMRNHPAFLFVDDAQGSFRGLPALPERVDYWSVSAHKLGGPRGMGVLFTRSSAHIGYISPRLLGDDGEHGCRAGTQPLAAVIGTGVALALAAQHAVSDAAWCAARIAELDTGLAALGFDVLHKDSPRAPHITVVQPPRGIRLQELDALGQVLALTPLTRPPEAHQQSTRPWLRLSVARTTSSDDVKNAIHALHAWLGGDVERHPRRNKLA